MSNLDPWIDKSLREALADLAARGELLAARGKLCGIPSASTNYLNLIAACALPSRGKYFSRGMVKNVEIRTFVRAGLYRTANMPMGQEMEVARIELLPEGSDADVRVYQCAACLHEMRLTVWATPAAANDSRCGL